MRLGRPFLLDLLARVDLLARSDRLDRPARLDLVDLLADRFLRRRG
jgi:hypothetical protein